MKHTYHPNTFGLLYGQTTKTACSKRVKTSLLVKPLETDCPACQEVILADMHTQQEMHDAATELVKKDGYASLKEWSDDNKPFIRDCLTPRKYRKGGVVLPKTRRV